MVISDVAVIDPGVVEFMNLESESSMYPRSVFMANFCEPAVVVLLEGSCPIGA